MSAVKNIFIGERKVGPNRPPFVIAEMSGNHEGSLEKALEMVAAASKTGVDAFKLQTFTADSITLDIREGDFIIDDPNSLWNGESLYGLYDKGYTPRDWHKPIIDRCRELDLICFSSPFDPSAVDFLESLNVPAYKIASFESVDLPLIRNVAATGKPMIISSGMATSAELSEAVSAARGAGCEDVILLKCTSTYPASPENTNLQTIPHLRQLFDAQVGISDHTVGIGVSVAAVAMGATVIEKHFVLDREDGGVDAAFSMEPNEMTALVEESKRAWQALGNIHYGPTSKEKASLSFRRSLYIAEDLPSGEVLTKENLRAIRPGFGLSPKYYDILLGKRVNRSLRKGTPMSWEFIG